MARHMLHASAGAIQKLFDEDLVEAFSSPVSMT
jgi:hypothetical protein